MPERIAVAASVPIRLLGPHRKRPCRSRSAERGYELPPSDADCHLTHPQRDHARCKVRRISRTNRQVWLVSSVAAT